MQDDNSGHSPLNEAKVLQSLDHPNIIKYYEAFIHNNKLCIVMEYADNGEILTKQKKKKIKIEIKIFSKN